ncbi:MAG: class I SAM-dependent methyltransferase [Eubacterium sp.]|nr:class I SAM-dependent methyltransferase [Eubacterium sp.]
MDKVKIEKNTVQETLVIPLFGRKLCTEKYPNLFQDKKAIELMNRLDYDFDSMAKNAGGFAQRFGALEVAMRESDLMWEVNDYIKTHPNASVVNMGCGLDQTAENCDNGSITIYNLDMPDVIEIRNLLLPETDRIKNISVDLNDTSWFDKINKENGVVFIAAGVFYYFTKEQMKALLPAMEKAFPGCKIAFDAANKRAVKLMLKTWVKDAGITSIDKYFSVEDASKDLGPWFENAKITSRGYMLGYNDLKDPSVSGGFRFMSKIADGFMNMQIIRIDF